MCLQKGLSCLNAAFFLKETAAMAKGDSDQTLWPSSTWQKHSTLLGSRVCSHSCGTFLSGENPVGCFIGGI